MGLLIDTVPARIGINTTGSAQRLEQPGGEQKIKQVKAEMILDWELPRVVIDQYQCFAEAGLKGNQDMIRDYAELGENVVLEYTGRIACEGDQFARIEDGRSAREVLAQTARENTLTKQEFNIAAVPQSRPRIEVTGHLNIGWRRGGAVIDYRPSRVVHNYQPGKVEIYLKQLNKIRIRYLDQRV